MANCILAHGDKRRSSTGNPGGGGYAPSKQSPVRARYIFQIKTGIFLNIAITIDKLLKEEPSPKLVYAAGAAEREQDSNESSNIFASTLVSTVNNNDAKLVRQKFNRLFCSEIISLSSLVSAFISITDR